MAVEHVGHQHRVTGLGEPVRHRPELRPQAEGVHVEQDRRTGLAVGGMGQIGVGGAVLGGDADVGSLYGGHGGCLSAQFTANGSPTRWSRAAHMVSRTIQRPAAPPAGWGPLYSNRDVSPAPLRTISASPPEKSITVVGSVPQSPESTTASST